MESQENINVEGGNKGGGFLCRQSSTRWTPTTEQIRILKDLYYNNGVRSPSAEQIQRISARLRQYGKIEGKNVFYWFQNHKARERQKKRFTTDLPSCNTMQPRSSFLNHPSLITTNPPPPPPSGSVAGAGMSCPSSSTGAPGVFSTVGGGSYGYGGSHHVNMNMNMNMNMVDKSFIRESSLVAAGGFGMVHHYQGDPYSSSSCANLLEKRRMWMEEESNNNVVEDEDEDEEDDDDDPEIETLPLFPMHAEDIKMNMNMNYYTGGGAGGGSGWYRSSDNGGSLELSLNSYSYSYYNH